ncbi:MAG: hypothetical protein ACPGJS_08010 [Flammeovirgaceae bacterium]
MKFLKFTFVIAAFLSLATIWGCDDNTAADPTLSGTWTLISATADGAAITNPTMTAVLSVTDADGNGTFTLSNISNVVAFNGSNTGSYTLSGTSSITFTTGTESNVADISSSPLTAGAGANWVVSFRANLAQHSDKDETLYQYTFQLQ